MVVQQNVQVAVRLDAVDDGFITAMTEFHPHRNTPECFAAADTFHAFQFIYRPVGRRFDKAYGHIFLLRQDELNVHHVINTVPEKTAADHRRAGGCDADDRQHGLDRLSFNVAEDNTRRLRQPAADASFLNQRYPVFHRRFRSHRFCRSLPGGIPQRMHRPAERSGNTDHDDRYHHLRMEDIMKKREPVGFHVQRPQHFAEPDTAGNPQQHACGNNHHHHRRVMNGNAEIIIAECFERADLLALRADGSAHDNVQQKGGDTDEYRGVNSGTGLELPEFLTQQPVGNLILASVSAKAAVPSQNVVQIPHNITQCRSRING